MATRDQKELKNDGDASIEESESGGSYAGDKFCNIEMRSRAAAGCPRVGTMSFASST